MPVIINGSTGISGTDGSAATPALQGTDANTGMFFPAADEIAFSEGGVEALRLNSSGNAIFSGTVRVGGIAADLYPLVLGTAQASTSGTSRDFLGIPSWAKRITVMFNGVSTNGTSPLILQIGTSSGFETSGYLSQTNTFDSGPGGVFATGSFALTSVNTAAYNWNGVIPICLIGSNLWVTSGVLMTASGSAATTIMAGSKTLAGTLDRLRIATVNGTDTFDAGSINVMWEG